MKKHFSLFAVILMCLAALVSCSKDYLIVEPDEPDKVEDASLSKTSSETFQGRLWIEGSLLVNNGITANLEGTNVCISDVIVTFLKDGFMVAQERPAVSGEIANPTEVTTLSSLPRGLNYERCLLCEDAVALPSEEYDQIEITINFLVRGLSVQADDIVWTCPYLQTDSYKCSLEPGYDYRLYVPIKLYTISFSPSVGDWTDV